MMTEESLADVVLGLAEDDPGLPDKCKYLIVAALESDEALASVLEADGADAPAAKPDTSEVGPEPVGAYLSSIEVAGFRGIGPRTTLELHPGPGLTIVAGRNGSGKSSFAEALELALTGNSYRWENRPAQWMNVWRNQSQPDPCAIRIGLAEEGNGAITIGVDWAPDAELDERKVWTQRKGAKQQPGTGSLGWKTSLVLYRPILSYEELGRLLDDRPAVLHDALERILGLGQINDATHRLDAALKRAQKPETDAKAHRTELREALRHSDDERAAAALTQLRKHKPDLEALSTIAVGTAEAPGEGVAALRALIEISLPELETVTTAAADLREAAASMSKVGADALSLVERRNALLDEALGLHAEHGDMPCPVCGDGALDGAWRERVSAQLAGDNERIARLRATKAELIRSRQEVRQLVEHIPPFPAAAELGLQALEPARAAYERWRLVPANDEDLADHIVTAHAELDQTVMALRAEAETLLRQREDAWAPIARRLAGWVDLMRQARAVEETTKELQRTTKWIKSNAGRLRNQQLAPLADEARGIWGKLRQESSVDLGAITLEGQKTRRRVAMLADIEGEEAEALSVMSQGELHALALALFLPRASRQESPLRFIVLDDPVQAMDPSKIDGFVQVCSELAADRQVVVFSHDDRLAEVVRRTADNARIVEVTRETGSRVALHKSLSPAMRYVGDARALAHDKALSHEVKTRALPGLCRLAVEAAARDTFYRSQLGAGVPRADVEAAWANTYRTRERVALALRGAPDADISSWRDAKDWRRRTLGICTSGAHQGLNGDPRNAVDMLERIVNDLLWTKP